MTHPAFSLSIYEKIKIIVKPSKLESFLLKENPHQGYPPVWA